VKKWPKTRPAGPLSRNQRAQSRSRMVYRYMVPVLVSTLGVPEELQPELTQPSGCIRSGSRSLKLWDFTSGYRDVQIALAVVSPRC